MRAAVDRRRRCLGTSGPRDLGASGPPGLGPRGPGASRRPSAATGVQHVAALGFGAPFEILAAFCKTRAVVYKKIHTLKGAIIGLVLGIVFAVIVSEIRVPSI